MQAQVYATVEQVFFAVALKQCGCIAKDEVVIGVQGYTKKQAETALNDWCANQNAPRQSFTIKSGFVPGNVTNYVVYHSNDWLASKSTEQMRETMRPPNKTRWL